MVAKTATINIRIDPAIKTKAESIYTSLGMTPAEAINVLFQSTPLVH